MKSTTYIKTTLVLLLCSFGTSQIHAQLAPECQLDIGMNLGGLADWGTELPFVDLMKNCRTWYTKDIGNPNAPFSSELESHLSYRTDGYPTHAPQIIPESIYPQSIVTIWAITSGWPPGEYTVLWEGTGTLSFWGTYQSLTQIDDHRIVFDFPNPIDGAVEMTIAESDINDPIRNIRVLMPGTESTYETEPFNPVWLDKLSAFNSVRFMDWGQTNNWGQTDGNALDPTLFDWADRSQMDHYTWAYNKGIPYEMMVKLMNDYNLDGWVCVPHRASSNYMSNMADYFRDNLDTDRHLTVEYSNEIWNWIFGQTQWLNEYGCIQAGVDWPQGLTPYVQNCLDHFTTSFDGQLHRITRAVGAFSGWPYITSTIVNGMTPGSFDAIAPTFYFGISEDDDQILDGMGSDATAADIAYYARQNMPQSIAYLIEHKNDIADPLGIPLKFYEGGQHLTPHPFGVAPTYTQALLDIQRDTAMYNLYHEWFDLLRPLQEGDEPLELMHFSFISQRSAQYGSWGMLETMDQDTSVIHAPKFAAILENLAPPSCQSALSVDWLEYDVQPDACSASIHWSTNTEENNSHFIISRSTDGKNYSNIAKIEGANYSDVRQDYQYVDSSLLPGEYYYKISQYDMDGSTRVLDIRAVKLVCEQDNLFDIFPNPVTAELNLRFHTDIKAQSFEILDTYGRIIQQQSLSYQYKNQIININTANLASGIYYLNIKTQDQIIPMKRFIKVE